MTEKEVGY